MEQKELSYLLKQATAVDSAQTASLKEVIAEYPYFQAARAVRLKGLKNENSLHYNSELKTTAAYTIDRSILFDFITSEEFNQTKVSDQIAKQENYQKNISVFEPKEIKKEDNLALNEALKMKVRESEQVFDPELFARFVQPEDKPLEKGEKEKGEVQKEKVKDPLQIGTPLSFKKDEIHSFSEWLKLTETQPIERTAKADEDENKSRKFELIDEFISKNPKISPSKNTKKTNLAKENLSTPDSLMTETLARVYLEQKNYKKAIQAYKILILKNPEKSGFFADQIRAIERLQEHNFKD